MYGKSSMAWFLGGAVESSLPKITIWQSVIQLPIVVSWCQDTMWAQAFHQMFHDGLLGSL
jgi:hypothetical protein